MKTMNWKLEAEKANAVAKNLFVFEGGKVLDTNRPAVLETLQGKLALQSLLMYMSLGNVDIGQMTVLFYQFNDAMFRLIQANKARETGNGALADKLIREVSRHFSIVFGKGRRSGDYVSPLGDRYYDEHLILSQDISADMIGKIWAGAQQMELTYENMLAVCWDIQAAGRFFSEETIDAAKNGTKVVIPGLEELKKLALMSRRNESGLKIDFSKKEIGFYQVREEGWGKKNASSREATFFLDDMYHHVAKEALAVVADKFDTLVKHEYAFSEALHQYAINLARNNKDAADVCRLVKQFYTTAFNGKRFEKEAIMSNDELLHEVKLDKIRALNDRMRFVFSDCTNMLRVQLANFAPAQRAALFLGVLLEDKAGATDEEISGALMSLLPQELVLMVASFKEAKEQGLDKVVVNGEERMLADLIEIPEADPNRLLVVTTGTATVGDKLNSTMSTIKIGQKLGLGYNEKAKIYDAVSVSGGEVIAHYRSAGRRIAKGEVNYINSIYNNRVGEVSDITIVRSVIGNKSTFTAMFTLVNVVKQEVLPKVDCVTRPATSVPKNAFLR